MTGSVRVLHVDDNPHFGEVVEEFLHMEGDQFDVSTAISADEGLQCIGDDGHAVDCIVSDFDMPGMDGIEFLEAVREESPELPFILYTGKGSEEVASDAISAGATDYLQKGGGSEQYTVLANRVENAVEQYRSRRRAAENERRFEALFNDPNLLVGLLETDGTVLNANETAMEYIDAEREAVIGEPFWTTPWWSEEMESVIRAKIEQAAAGQYVEYEADLAKPDGGKYSVTGVIRPVTDEHGDVVSLIVSARDVTDRVSRERILDAILENTTVPMFLKNRAGEYLLVNEAFRTLFGLEDTEVRGRTDADLLDPETAAEVQENDRRVLERGEPLDIEERILADGDEKVYLSSKTPIYDIGTASDPDDPVAIFGVASDITDRT